MPAIAALGLALLVACGGESSAVPATVELAGGRPVLAGHPADAATGDGAGSVREGDDSPGTINLEPCSGRNDTLCGSLTVFEDRAAGSGRTIDLNIRVIPADRKPRMPDPVLVLAGGPGQAATSLAGWARRQWIRDPHRDLILVDQRGTGGSNGLSCDLSEAYGDPFAAMDAIFEDPALLQRCRRELERKADLRFYTTPLAMDDLDDVRRALGYDRINIVGGSYGSRAGLVYLRRHGDHVRAAVLWGPAPLANTLPLYHARSGQRALDRILDQCAAEERCAKAFPSLRREVDDLLARLQAEPVEVTLTGRQGGKVRLTRDGFAEAVRILMYNTRGGRKLPALLHKAWEGDYGPFVRAGSAAMGGILDQIDMGMLLSVVCSEDVPRIDRSQIPALTEGSFLGDARIRAQLDICAAWPRGDVPEGFGDPVRFDGPVLVISGEMDPVTPPEWGEEMVRHLPRGRHVAVPRAHDVGSPCVAEFASAFLHGDPEAPLDLSCVEEMALPAFEVD